MVRAIVGTMVEVGFGKMDLKEFEDIILAKDRCKAGKSAPAKGLFLADIEYPEEIYL
jgi:tRNA pseudouridine38-40 synthase